MAAADQDVEDAGGIDAAEPLLPPPSSTDDEGAGGNEENYADVLAEQFTSREKRRSQRQTITDAIDILKEEAKASKEGNLAKIDEAGTGSFGSSFHSDAVGAGSHGDHGHHHHKSTLRWYDPPIQRQRWGEAQSLPHVDWGNIFFDLFYVGAALNLGVLLASSINSEHRLRGIIYYLGTFGPLWNAWESDTYIESRYSSVDVFHSLVELFRQLCTGLAICFISGVGVLGNPKSENTLLFTIFIVAEGVITLLVRVEICVKALGDREAIRNYTRSTIIFQLVPVLLLNIAGLVTSAYLYVRSVNEASNNHGHGLEHMLWNPAHDGAHVGPEEAHDAHGAPDDAHNATENSHGVLPDEIDDGHDGHGAPVDSHGEELDTWPMWQMADLPLTILAFTSVLTIALTAFRKVKDTQTKDRDIRSHYVPENVDYVIHRYGEFCMLMFGEGILQIAVSDHVIARNFYITVSTGFVTYFIFASLKFSVEPHGKDHAMWRGLISSTMYGILIQALSMSLIAFGVAYKNLLKNVAAKHMPADAHGAPHAGLSLTAGVAAHVERDEAALHFEESLAAVVVSLELLSLTHVGIVKATKRLTHWPIALVTLFRVGIIVYAAFLARITEDPGYLATLGLSVAVLLAIARTVDHVLEPRYAAAVAAATATAPTDES